MTDKTALKPCPFCGNEAVTLQYNGPSEDQISTAIAWGWDYDVSYYAECNACQATGPAISGREEAEEAWNSRVIDNA